MASFKWHFKLSGHPVDLRRLDGTKYEHWRINNDELILEDDVNDVSQYEQVMQIAKQALGVLNGIAKTLNPDHLEVGGVLSRFEDGDSANRCQFIIGMDSIRSEEDVPDLGIVVGNNAEPRVPRKEQLSLIAAEDSGYREALNLFTMATDWRELYVALEVIQRNCPQGSALAGWPSNNKIKLFKNTSGNYATLGDKARHGDLRELPNVPMTIEEARQLIWTMMDVWARELLTKKG